MLVTLSRKRPKPNPQGVVKHMLEAASILPADALDLGSDIRIKGHSGSHPLRVRKMML